MRIDRVDIKECIMPNKDRTWRIAHGTISEITAWIVRIVADNGTVGYGYGQVYPVLGATHFGVRAALDFFVPLLIGQDPFAIDTILRKLDSALLENNQAKAAIDSALYDLKARALGVPVYELLGGKTCDSIPQLRIVPIKPPAEMALFAQGLVDQGYRYLKIKVVGTVAEDVERVRSIRKQVGPDIHLTIDANEAYDPKSAIQTIRRMEEYGIDLVEQPVPMDDLKGLELVTHSVETIIEADDSARSPSDVVILAADRIVDAVSIKIGKMGGLRRAWAVADICAAAGLKYRVGAAFGSRLLAAACVHFVAATPGIWYACELAQFDELLNDPFEGLEVDNGEISVPDGPGLGVQPRDWAL